jgi:NRPS condensation-like uncharacterized protein
MVLPLPLSPFESYMLADDRPAYPMNCFLRLRFAGRFDRAAMDAAMSIAVSRHPLLAAVVRRSGRKDFWVAADQPPAVQWLSTPPTESLPPLAPLDVRATAGLRVVSCEEAGKTDLTIQVHHACCDGFGMLRFTEDMLTSYAGVCGAAPGAALRALCPEQLRGRGRFGLTPGKFLRMLPKQAVGLRGARRFLMRTPEPLVPHRSRPDNSPAPPGYPASLTRQLDRTESAGLISAARRLGVTANDLLVRDCFLTLHDWRRRTADYPGSWLRLTVPVNLRTMADRRLPAANAVSMVFLDRLGRDMENPQRLLDSVHRQMSLIKRLHLGLTFVLSLQVCRWLPGGLHRMTRASRCAATGVLTNMGAVLDRCPLPYQEGRLVAGDAVLQSMDALAPLRPLTCAAIAVLVYAGRVHITLHYDSRVLTATNACELIDDFAARVRQSTGAGRQVAVEVGR